MTQVNHSPTDRTRQLMDLALSCGRSWQSPQTGFIHYCAQLLDENLHHTMPLYENVLFALALMRSRIAENITEGKQILECVLNFQNLHDGEAKGNFPVYIHEYPRCSDRLHGIHFLAPLYWLYQQFHHVIGAALKKKVEDCLVHLAAYCQAQQAPYHLAVKSAAGVKAVAKLLHNDVFLHAADKQWASLMDKPDPGCWLTSSTMSDLLVAYQLIYPELSTSPEKLFWQHLIFNWHQGVGAYCGPSLAEYQRGLEPQVTLYDYFMGFYSSKYPYRFFFDHPIQLQAILIQPCEDHIPAALYPLTAKGVFKTLPWELWQHETWSYSLIEKSCSQPIAQEKGYAPLKILWGDATRLHSLVCQGGNITNVSFAAQPKHIDMFFTLAAEASSENRDKSRDISFFVDVEEILQVRIAGLKATTFQMGESITLLDDKLKINMLFSVHSGSGVFMGHIMKGNRPAQLTLKGEHRFAAYDWQIFLRAIERSNPCIIKVSIDIDEVS